MNIVNLHGGLGNQLFQYAFGLALKHKYGLNIKFSNNFINHNQLKIEDIFDIEIPYADDFDYSNNIGLFFKNDLIRGYFLRILNKFEIYNFNNFILENYKNPFLSIPEFNNKFFFGYWQNYNYFYPYLRKIKSKLKFRKSYLIDNKIKNISSNYSNLVCLHIRLGDYKSKKNLKVFNEISIRYYKEAIDYFKKYFKKPLFILFTNQLDKVDEELINIDSLISSHSLNFDLKYDFYLMSLCDAYIFSNSTFSIWAAYLSKKIDIFYTRPKFWYKDPYIENANSYYPSNWTLVK